MTLTTTQALEQSIQLYRQNLKYDDIANHLKKLGYVSERTRKPLTGQAIRHNVIMELRRRGEPERGTPRAGATAAKEEITTAPIHVSGPKADLLSAVKEVMSLDLSPDQTLKVIKALLG